MKKFKLYPLSFSIKKTLALSVSSLMLTSLNISAEAYKNPNDIWIGLPDLNKICTLDFDQDGDLDIVHYYEKAITLQENVGSLISPLFTPQKVIASQLNKHLIKELDKPKESCAIVQQDVVSVDIDNDGDLDRFEGDDYLGISLPNRPINTTGLENQTMEFHEKTDTEEFKQSNNTFGLPLTARSFAFIDMDLDGDLDVLVDGDPSLDTGGEFYENIGTPEQASFVKQDISFKCENEAYIEGIVIDLNGDNKPDQICKDATGVLSSPNGYIQQSHLYQDSPDEIIDGIYRASMVDINQDGNPELDITFKESKFGAIESGKYTSFLNLSIEEIHNINTGLSIFNRDNSPLFIYPRDIPGTDDIEARGDGFTMGDIDGDGDLDLYNFGDRKHRKIFYDNVGTSEEPIYEHISNIAYPGKSFSWLDLDNDGRVDSTLSHGYPHGGDRGLLPTYNSRLLYKGMEPATNIVVSNSVIVVNKPSQVQLMYGDDYDRSNILPNTAKEVSLAIGNFIQTAGEKDHNEIALAIIDENGFIQLNIYDRGLNLISHGKGGKAHSIAISAGQLDNDLEDEVVVTFVQENGTVLSAAVNFDMSIVGSVQQGQGKNPSVAVGNFSNTSGSYVMSYITPDNQLKISTIQGDGTIISQTDGGTASDAKISTATFLPSTPEDEYVVSTLQPNGVAGLIGFSSNGDKLGQLTGGVAQQPTVISLYSKTKESLGEESLGLAVSLIQADKKPAVIFLDNQGNYLATGVGGKTAVTATITDGGSGKVILAYVDEDGIPRWEIFGSDGVKQKP